VLAIGCIDAFTSLVCGSTVFSVLGYMAKSQSKTIENVVQQGPGLVFMVLPEAIRNMSLSPLWAILFFSMIFLLGIDSQVNFFSILLKYFKCDIVSKIF
jgi:solute carrier family 6 GABA transporter-like protein 1